MKVIEINTMTGREQDVTLEVRELRQLRDSVIVWLKCRDEQPQESFPRIEDLVFREHERIALQSIRETLGNIKRLA